MSDVTPTNMSQVRSECISLFETQQLDKKLYVLVEEASGIFCDSEHGLTTCVTIECLNNQVLFMFFN